MVEFSSNSFTDIHRKGSAGRSGLRDLNDQFEKKLAAAGEKAAQSDDVQAAKDVLVGGDVRAGAAAGSYDPSIARH